MAVSILTGQNGLIGRYSKVGLCESVQAWDLPLDVSLTDLKGKELLYVSEEGSRTCRVCCPRIAPTTYRVYNGKNTQGQVAGEFRRGLRLPLLPFKCCCHQALYVTDGKSPEDVGYVMEEFWVVMPSFALYNNVGQAIGKTHYSTCCTGLFYDFCPDNNPLQCCCLQPPFVFHQVNTSSGRASERSDGTVTHTLGPEEGKTLPAEMAAFLLKFPENTTLSATDRLIYLGAAMLINDTQLRKRPMGGEDFCSCFACLIYCSCCSDLPSCSKCSSCLTLPFAKCYECFCEGWCARGDGKGDARHLQQSNRK